ncbi:MAG: hypothetical protein GY765_30625, partial [bacterium]|nr:hypothetical protein [bacterium]
SRVAGWDDVAGTSFTVTRPGYYSRSSEMESNIMVDCGDTAQIIDETCTGTFKQQLLADGTRKTVVKTRTDTCTLDLPFCEPEDVFDDADDSPSESRISSRFVSMVEFADADKITRYITIKRCITRQGVITMRQRRFLQLCDKSGPTYYQEINGMWVKIAAEQENEEEQDKSRSHWVRRLVDVIVSILTRVFVGLFSRR